MTFSSWKSIFFAKSEEERTIIQLSEHFTYKKLLKFTYSSAIMMIFTSIYGVVDGLFLSNFAGKMAFAGVNFIMPFLMILGGFGFMFGSGGSALVAKTLGEGNKKHADEIFTMLFVVSVLTGIFLSVGGNIFLRPLLKVLGADGELLENSLLYGRIYLIGVPACIVQYEFQNLYATAGKPKLGLYSTITSGITNIILDALFVALFRWGITGAAFATIISQFIGSIIPFIYFVRENTSLLKFVKTKIQLRPIAKMCMNGASDLLNNTSLCIVSMIFNSQLLKYAGDNGLAAYGVMMYINFLFISIYVGYVVGVSPIISYHYGAKNHLEIRSLLIKSSVLLGIASLLMFVISEVTAIPISKIFAGYDKELFVMTLRGFRLFSFRFFFTGLAIFGTAFFTALNNGLVSAIISFMRTIVFQIALVYILPLFWELDGIWLSAVIGEGLTVILSLIFILCNKKKYHY